MNADQMPLNQTVVVAQADFFRSTATRISSDVVELVYFDQPTGDETMKIHARVDGTTSELISFDRVYWKVQINGRAATEADLEDITKKASMRMAADAVTRTITIIL